MHKQCSYSLSSILCWSLLGCSPFFSGFHRLKNGKDVLGEVLQPGNTHKDQDRVSLWTKKKPPAAPQFLYFYVISCIFKLDGGAE